MGEVDAGAVGRRRAASRWSRALGWLSNPAWVRAPFLLRRFPGILAAVFGAGFILAAVSASSPLFVSSAENEALHASLAGQCPWTGGLAINAFQPLSGKIPVTGQSSPTTSQGLFAFRDGAVDHAVAGIGGLAPKELTIFGSVAQAARPGSARVVPLVRLMSRDGYRRHISVVSGGSVPGVWVPDDTARFLGVRAGDPIRLTLAERSVRSRVSGIYRSLVSQPPTAFWCSQSTEIYGLDPNSAPPALLMVDRPTMLALSDKLGEGNASVTWEFAIRQRGLTLPDARLLAAQVAEGEGRLPSFGGGAFSAPQRVSQIQALVPQVMDTIDQIRSPAFSVALAGRLVALLVLAAIGFYWLDRRRIEAALLSAKGIGPFGVAMKAALEVVLPLAVASAAGWVAAVWLVRWLGPGSLLSQTAPRSAAVTVAWTAVAGLLLFTFAVASAVRASESGALGASVIARTPWDLVILLLMGASLYEILTRGGGAVLTPSGQTKVDILLILFPILFVGGASALAVRGLRRLLPRLRALGTGRSPAVFLATRRLTAASGIALALVTAVALAVGILAYSATLSASTEASASAKAKVFVGSDVRATLLQSAAVPPALASRSTVVYLDEGVTVMPDQTTVSVIEVDPATFARGAYWDPSFSDRSLSDLLGSLRESPGPGLPVIVVGGGVPAEGMLRFNRANATLPYHLVTAVRAFPLQRQHETFVVVDANRLQEVRSEAVPYVIAMGDLAGFERALSGANVPYRSTVSAEQVQASPTTVALTWLYGYLLAMGVVTGLIVLAALVLYLAARQRGRVVSYALARRMGLRAGQHRRSLLVEIVGMLLIGSILGAGFAALGARLVSAKLDPLPNLPPPALFRMPWALYWVTAGVLLAAAWIGARLAQRSAEAANVAEVMRVAI